MLNNPTFVSEQYRDSRNLNARIALHERYSTATRNLYLWILDHFDLRDKGHILELGCGTGALWAANRERIPNNWRLTLCDFSYEMLRTARLNFPLATFLQLDAQTIPFPNDSFDAIVADHMLYHIPNLARALSDARRVLRIGGKLYAVTNGNAHMKEYFDFIGNFVGVEKPREPLQFTLENGARQLRNYFECVERIDFQDSLNVTEAEPLVRYALSGFVGKKWLDSSRESELRDAVAKRIAKDGAFSITKSTGLFIATKS